MIHCFKALGLNVVMDIESGAVHCVDELAFLILKGIEDGKDRATLEEELKSSFPAEDIEETFAEIDELTEAGQLFSPVPYSQMPVSNPRGVIKAMCLHVAHDCNLRCKYCFAQTGDFGHERELMDPETGKAALDFLISKSGNRKNLEVDFFGGEPLMNLGVVKELVSYGRELEKKHGKTFKFTITTNGIALNDETIDYFHKEMENVVISLDGRQAVHDKMRPTSNNKGSFELIFPQALKLAKDRSGKKSYYVRGTFTAYNPDFSRDVLFLADAGFDQVSIEPVVAPKDMDYCITEDMVPGLKREYDTLMEEYYDRRKNGKWFNFFHFQVDLKGGPCLPKRLVGCGAGNEYVAITPKGDIYPCHQFVGDDEMLMGNVHTKEFRTDMQDGFRKNNVVAKQECSACWAKYYCSGGCAANAYHENGSIDKPYKIGCELERKRLECAIALNIKEENLDEEDAQ